MKILNNEECKCPCCIEEHYTLTEECDIIQATMDILAKAENDVEKGRVAPIGDTFEELKKELMK